MKNIHIEKLPANVSYLSTEAHAAIGITDGELHLNTHNGHHTLHASLPSDYYDNYLMTATYSAKMQQHQAAQAGKLAGMLQAESHFIEIGCGDGSFMKHCAPLFKYVMGIEPSGIFAAEARAQGFDVLECYVSEDAEITQKKFHAFASRQVFEHLPNPVSVLKGIRNMLNPGAVGLIEVPNGIRSLLSKRFYDYFPDHIQYYSPASLIQMATEAGFITLSCETSFGGDYLELWLTYVPNLESTALSLVEMRKNVCLALSNKLIAWKNNHKNIAIWGVGAKTQSIMPLLNSVAVEAIGFAIDSDPHKHGKYIPGTAIQIKAPAFLTSSTVDVVLILALSYRTEIMQQAMALNPHIKEIWTIDDNGLLTNEWKA